MMSVNFEYYKVFFYVAKSLNITHAANELFLTQPAVSKAIQNLEYNLGCLLFTRNKRGVELTPEGTMLYNQIQPACSAIFAAEEEIERMKSLDAGIVRISSNDTGVKTVLLPVIKKYREQYPDVTIEICRYSPDDMFTALSKGSVDLILDFYAGPYVASDEPSSGSPSDSVQASKSSDIKKLVLKTFHDTALVGQKLSYLADEELQIDDLIDYPLIIPKTDIQSKDFYLNLFRKSGLKRPVDMEITGAALRILFTQQNLGISFMPMECVMNEIRNGSLFPLNVKEKLLKRHLVLLMSRTRNLSLAETKFIEMLFDSEHIVS